MAITRVKIVLYTTIFTMLIGGCSNLPVSDQARYKCSADNNAYNASTRIFNGGYWACMNSAGREEQNLQQQQAQYQAENNLRNRCSSFGFKQGSDAFSQCIQRETNRYESCAASQAAIQQRVNQCTSQCYTSMNVMECNNRCVQQFNVPPNC